MRDLNLYALLLMFVFYIPCNGQSNPGQTNTEVRSEADIATRGPVAITRNLIQDRKGTIWIAAFDGVFRYDGKSFSHATRGINARFFSVLEDKKGNVWFGTIGSGIYRYDGTSFENMTTKNGLLNDEVTWIYEDKTGRMWFGVNGGACLYDGKSFRNFILYENGLQEDKFGIIIRNLTRPVNEVNSIIEDKTGKLWFATRGKTYIYNGETFASITDQLKQPFTNVRTLVEDKRGNIWLGGNDGLWRYDGRTFTQIKDDFTGFLYEDRKGNIWASSETNYGPAESNTSMRWALSRYEEKSLADEKPAVKEINPASGMLFGILEANDGSIWFGGAGAYRYDGKTITKFRERDLR